MEKQFLLVVRHQRGFPTFQLMAVATNYDTFSDINVNASLGGGSSPQSWSLTEPNDVPFTLTATE